MKRILIILFIFCIIQGLIYSEDNASSIVLQSNIGTNEQKAMSNPEYLVTPGDVYTLAYMTGKNTVNYTIFVDSSYKIRVSNMAIIDATGKTYLEIKNQIESIVSKNYPLSGVQFIMQTAATFNILIKGEVIATTEISAWGLSRLSSVLNSVLTKYSSIRDISIISNTAKTQTFDLFKAQRYGDLSQDPYLRPGDIIVINRIKRVISLSGAVERPGVYQLLENEGFSELINQYGNGFSPLADKSRIELIRYVESESNSGNKIFLNQSSLLENYKLNNFDSITVFEITDLIPVMFIEGAIGPKIPANPEVSARESIRFNTGENYASIIRRSRALFTSISDTAGAYIIRNGTNLPINLNPMLYDASYISSYSVEVNDVLIIPFRQYFITVTGAVAFPGRYPYIQDRDWSYYIALAGGFDTTRNNFSSVRITDIRGKRQKKGDAIAPETRIDASNNTVRYYFNQYSPVILTTFTIIAGYIAFRGNISTLLQN